NKGTVIYQYPFKCQILAACIVEDAVFVFFDDGNAESYKRSFSINVLRLALPVSPASVAYRENDFENPEAVAGAVAQDSSFRAPGFIPVPAGPRGFFTPIVPKALKDYLEKLQENRRDVNFYDKEAEKTILRNIQKYLAASFNGALSNYTKSLYEGFD